MPKRFLLLACLLALAMPAARADDDDLESTLGEVGEQYAIAYLTPLVHSFGANQNSGLFHTAHIPRRSLTFSIGLKVQGAHLSAGDQSFRRVLGNVALNDYLDLEPGDPYYGATGDVVFEGPTAIGDDEVEGTATAYVDGLPVYQEGTISGLVKTRWVPLVVPELQVGGFAGLKGSLRWVPESDVPEVGQTKLFGYGLQWSPNVLLPAWPVDVIVGFARQEIDVGTLLETEASSVFVAASKQYGLATLYGGLAKESSSVKVSYVEEFTGDPVEFEMDGVMESRVTIGTTLDLGVMVNLEAGIGDLAVYNFGLLFGK
ncbi:MAG TPA: hypothetical protein PLL30_14080 [Candidatus Krumholzibacteria bacterium]|nr:hypothetical protein [Candidatus Krumholzibacteria bacterium]HPD72894.1 hypothetical protein [Candidatus Krumholzibacteria bacterium]HRY41693.1 hypothetical protein [Candidatus Krumholzibacteria bacterium]